MLQLPAVDTIGNDRFIECCNSIFLGTKLRPMVATNHIAANTDFNLSHCIFWSAAQDTVACVVYSFVLYMYINSVAGSIFFA